MTNKWVDEDVDSTTTYEYRLEELKEDKVTTVYEEDEVGEEELARIPIFLPLVRGQ